jgi:hypothetical protein
MMMRKEKNVVWRKEIYGGIREAVFNIVIDNYRIDRSLSAERRKSEIGYWGIQKVIEGKGIQKSMIHRIRDRWYPVRKNGQKVAERVVSGTQ